MFDKKLVPIPDFKPGVVSPPPHLDWVNDYGEKRIPELRDGTQRLLGVIAVQKETPPTDAVVADCARKWMSAQQRAQAWQKSVDKRVWFNMATSMGICFEGIRRQRESRPDTDPFVGVDVDTLLAPPDYVMGKADAVGWPVMVGRLAYAAESQLGWKRAQGKVNRCTWAALMGWTYDRSEETVDASAFEQPTEESIARLVVAGTFVMGDQSAIMGGYRAARANLP